MSRELECVLWRRTFCCWVLGRGKMDRRNGSNKIRITSKYHEFWVMKLHLIRKTFHSLQFSAPGISPAKTCSVSCTMSQTEKIFRESSLKRVKREEKSWSKWNRKFITLVVVGRARSLKKADRRLRDFSFFFAQFIDTERASHTIIISDVHFSLVGCPIEHREKLLLQFVSGSHVAAWNGVKSQFSELNWTDWQCSHAIYTHERCSDLICISIDIPLTT